MAYRRSDDDLAYGERWDRDRFTQESDRNRYGGERERFEERDRSYSRGLPTRVREPPTDDRFERRPLRPWDDGYAVREKRYYDEEPRHRRSPPPELERRLVHEREREREYRSPSPPPRPTLLRRQSSLDTFDRRPAPRYYDKDEYAVPSRRGDYRPDPYQPIPLPRSRALPPPRIYAEREYDDIKISEPERYGDEEYHTYPERFREREMVKSRRRRERSGSRTSRARTHKSSTIRSSSRSSTTTSSSSSSSSGGTTVTVKSEYPKKGKTRIPGKLVSKRALIDLGYPFVEEGSTIIVQKALGQQNIDDLLKLSEEYKKSEQEVAAARSSAAGLVEERRTEVFTIPPQPPAPPASIHVTSPPPPPPAPPAEIVKETVYREPSPSSTYRSRSTSASTRTPLIVEAGPREYSDGMALGPLALVSDRRRNDRDIKMEIARLEAERDLMKRDHHHHHHSHSRHRSHSSHSHSADREMVRAERLPTGELVLYEEQVEKIEEPRRGVRIEKDKKGRMTISVPKNR